MGNKLSTKEIDEFVGVNEVEIIHKEYSDYGKLTFCKNSKMWSYLERRIKIAGEKQR